MELLCATCILVANNSNGSLKDCLPLVVASMIRRLGGEGVLSKVKVDNHSKHGDYAMRANDTGDTNLEGPNHAANDEEGSEDDISSMDNDDADDWDDEADVFNEDALVTEFGRFLEALCIHFPELSAASDSSEKLVQNPEKNKRNAGTPTLVCRRSLSVISWPGVPEESARVLSWVLDRHRNGTKQR